jgi:hypothetical protein
MIDAPALYARAFVSGGAETVHSAEQFFDQSNPWARSRGASDFLRDMTSGMTHEQRLAQVRWFAGVMDDAFHVPGTGLRFGWDSILGLFPGLGDVLTSALSLLIVHHAWQTGASKLTLARMLGNIGVDFVVGSVPLIGDLFDFVWKANRKNARLLEQHLHMHAAKRSGRPLSERLLDRASRSRPR